MEIDAVLQAVRLVSLLVAVFLIGSYHPDEHSARRLGITAVAIALSGGCLGLAVSTALFWRQWLEVPSSGQFCLTAVFLVLLCPLIAGRGNVAVLFPRKVWTHRP